MRLEKVFSAKIREVQLLTQLFSVHANTIAHFHLMLQLQMCLWYALKQTLAKKLPSRVQLSKEEMDSQMIKSIKPLPNYLAETTAHQASCKPHPSTTTGTKSKPNPFTQMVNKNNQHNTKRYHQSFLPFHASPSPNAAFLELEETTTLHTHHSTGRMSSHQKYHQETMQKWLKVHPLVSLCKIQKAIKKR